MSAPSKRFWIVTGLSTAAAVGGLLAMNCVGLSELPLPLSPRAHPPEPRPAQVALRRSIEERLSEIDARLRLPPDRRVLHALVELDRWVRGVAPDAELAFPVEAPRLPELATFADILALLDAQPAGLPKLGAGTVVAPELVRLLDAFDPQAAFRALEIVDERWRAGTASVADLRSVANALAQLSLILWDDFEIADRFQGQALAALALARRHGAEEMRRAEIQLALALGYSSHALLRASGLPERDPLAAYLRRNAQALEQSATGGSATGEAKFLYALRLAEEGRFKRWVEWVSDSGRRPPSLALARTYLTAGELRSAAWVPDYVAMRLQQTVGVPDPADPRRTDMFTRADPFMAQLRSRASALAGPFASSASYRTYHQALFFTAIYQKYRYHNNLRASQRDLHAFAEVLAASTDPDVLTAAEFARLMDYHAPRKPGEDRQREQALERDSVLGARQRLHLARMLYVPLIDADRKRLELADAMSRWLDSRPRHLVWASELAHEVYLDPVLEEKFTETAIARNELASADLRLELAKARADEAELWEMLDNPDLPVGERIDVLSTIGQIEGCDRARVRRAFERELAARGASYRAVQAHAWFLSEIEKDLAGARKLYHTFLADPGDESGIAVSHVTARLAALYRRDGQPRKAWEILEPELESWVGSVLEEAKDTQIALGNLDKAELWARRSLERYPGAESIADVLDVLWRQKRHEEAAQLIQTSPDLTSSDARGHLIWAFLDVFAESGGPEMDAAFRELVAARTPWDLTQGIIVTLREQKKRPDLAFALTQHMDYPPNYIVVHTEGYISQREAAGEPAALEWIRAKMPRNYLDVTAPIFYLRGAPELLWTVNTDPEDNQGGDETWLLRAAAWVKSKDASDEQRRALTEYYRTHTATVRDRVGAVLLELRSEDDLLREVRTEEDLVLAASFLGLRAEVQGRTSDALRLYQLARSARPATPQDYYPVRRLAELQTTWPKLRREAALAADARAGAPHSR